MSLKTHTQWTKEEIEAGDLTVERCLEIQPTAHGCYYLIETTFNFPRFVIGEIHDSHGIRHLLKCGAEWSARDSWTRLLKIIETGGSPSGENLVPPVEVDR